MIGAVDVIGNNLKFTHLRIVGFGTKAGRECFPMFIHVLEPSMQGPPSFGNVLVEDCVVSDPAHDNTGGLTTISVAGRPSRPLTNAVVRRCSITGLKPYFAPAQAFSAVHIENCLVADCSKAVYFEPALSWGDNLGPVLIRSNQFLNVDLGVFLSFHAAAQFDSVTMLANEIVLTGPGGAGFASCDTCDAGPSGSITNVTALNNIVRYAGWSVRPASIDFGLQSSDIHNAVFGNNVIALGTQDPLRIRPCPAGIIPPTVQPEICDSDGHTGQAVSGPTYLPCLDALPSDYRRAWFNNRDLRGELQKVRYLFFNSDGFALQQQWP